MMGEEQLEYRCSQCMARMEGFYPCPNCGYQNKLLADDDVLIDGLLDANSISRREITLVLRCVNPHGYDANLQEVVKLIKTLGEISAPITMWGSKPRDIDLQKIMYALGCWLEDYEFI